MDEVKDNLNKQSSYENMNDENFNDDGYDREGSDTYYEDLEDRWYEIQDEYRSRFSDITDDDVNVEPGRFERTLDRIGRRRGKSPGEVRDEIENW